MKKSCMCILIAAVCIWAAVGVVQAQVVRESGVGSVAGVLQDDDHPYNDFYFKGSGNQIVFVDLDAEMYMIPGGDHGGGCGDTTGGGCEETATADSGGCTGGGSSGSSEGCGCEDTGGPGRFRLEVFRLGEEEPLCAAGKPKRPGWDRDPRLACHLIERGDYLLRVSLASPGEHPDLSAETPSAYYPYLVNVTLRGIAADGSSLTGPGRSAFWQSQNQFGLVPF